MKKVTHYKDTLTGQYVTRSKWARSKAHGGTRYKRTKEKYVPPQEPPKKKKREITPPPPPPIGIQRLKYIGKRANVSLEIHRINGIVSKVKVGRRFYSNKKDIAKFAPLLNAAIRDSKL